MLAIPEVLIMVIDLSIIAIAYFFIFPRFVGSNFNKLLIYDLFASSLCLLVNGFIFWNTGTKFNAVLFTTNWFWFSIFIYLVIELPFGAKYLKKYGISLFLIVIALHLPLYVDAEATEIHLAYHTTTGKLPIKTWKELRDHQIEKQDEDFSCGSASVATILRFFYGKEVYEKDILDEVIRFGKDGTASFSDLEQAVKKFGFKAIGLALSFEKLKSLKIPAIVYLQYRDKDHFSVIRGVSQQGLVWLGDPSWGNRKFPENQFRAMWETRGEETLKGKILLIIPQDKSLEQLNKAFFKPPTLNTTAIQLLTLRR